MKRVNVLAFLAVVALVISSNVLMAQAPPPPVPPNGVPIDGASALVLIAGAAFGVRQLVKNFSFGKKA